MPLSGNTAKRIIVSIVTIPLILLSSYYGGIFFLSLVCMLGAAGYYEFSRMAHHKKAFASDIVGIAAVSALIVNAYFHFSSLNVAVYGIVLLLLLTELFRNNDSAVLNLGASLLGILYPGMFSAAVIEIRQYFVGDYHQGGLLIIAIMITIWACDSAAFFIGSAIGRHKLFVRVSPKKSWEGAVAGFISATATMIISRELFLGFISFENSLIIGILVGIVGQLGDLVESLLKRDAGVKDSSNFIPGHGGIFDRFDSLLMSAPAVYLYLYYFVQP
ncbi:MAG: phosphatidate cytidylyltransferase [Ignavibacteria bacterium]